jgi:hypothetical protein
VHIHIYPVTVGSQTLIPDLLVMIGEILIFLTLEHNVSRMIELQEIKFYYFKITNFSNICGSV